MLCLKGTKNVERTEDNGLAEIIVYLVERNKDARKMMATSISSKPRKKGTLMCTTRLMIPMVLLRIVSINALVLLM